MEVTKREYGLGYALCGGGAKGFAHLGAFKLFEEYNLKPDVIAGTSAGALAGVFYADGWEPEEIAEFFRGQSFLDFAQPRLGSAGFFRPNGVAKMLKDNLRAKSFEHLSTPFVAVAVNWETAEVAAFSEGKNLVEAVVASCTIPVIFEPQVIKGVQYVDGGVLKTLPVSVIRDQCEQIIAVNLSQLHPFKKSNNIRDAAYRYFDIASKSNVKEDLELADILIDVKDLEDVGIFDLKSIDQIMQSGYDAAKSLFKEHPFFRDR